MERISTGIKCLDDKLDGGYPKGKGVLITGVPGSGKTIFGLHALDQGCIDGKKCVMVATEESPEDILVQAEMLGLDLKAHMDNGKLEILRVLEQRTRDIAQASEMIKGFSIREIDMIGIIDLIPDDAEFVVIDNIGVFAIGMEPKEFRDKFDMLNLLISQKNFTTLLVMDEASYNLTHQIADYSTYGCLKISIKENPYTGNMERYLVITKMRSTNISLDANRYDITSHGIELHGAGSGDA
ncbi:hypothetical protein HNV12_04710 [Methanococcoides sp. SA1]|nr:hypothetical protein [Methanococcoides sp. SA1]